MHDIAHGETELSFFPSQLSHGMCPEEDMLLSAIMEVITAALAPCAMNAIAISTVRKALKNLRCRRRISPNIADLGPKSKFDEAS